MVAARERFSFGEANRDRGGHGVGDTLKTPSSMGPLAHSPSRRSRSSFARPICDRAGLVGCQPIFRCSTAARPDQ